MYFINKIFITKSEIAFLVIEYLSHEFITKIFKNCEIDIENFRIIK